MPKCSVRKRFTNPKKGTAQGECGALTNPSGTTDQSFGDVLGTVTNASQNQKDDSNPQCTGSAPADLHINFVDDISMPDAEPSSNSVDSTDPLAVIKIEDDDTFQLKNPASFDTLCCDPVKSLKEDPTISVLPSAASFKLPSSDTDTVIDYQPLLKQVKIKLESFLKPNWVSLVQENELHVLRLSRTADKVTQRQLTFRCDGSVQMKVHCREFPITKHMPNALPPKCLQANRITYFVNRIVQLIDFSSEFEICCGVPQEEYKHVWSAIDYAAVDSNPYKETRYTETFRALQCELLVYPIRKYRCYHCFDLLQVLQRKTGQKQKKKLTPYTPS